MIIAIPFLLIAAERTGNWLINDPCVWSCEERTLTDEERDQIIDKALQPLDPDRIVDDAIRDAR
jgi:Zn-finger protein